MAALVRAHPWDRVEREPEKAFRAFRVYLNSSTIETPDKPRFDPETVAAMVDEPVQAIRSWIKRFDWPNRAVLYDSYMHTVDDEAFKAEIKKIARHRAKVAEKALNVADISLTAAARGMADYATSGGAKLTPKEARDAATMSAVLVKDIAGQVAPPAQQVQIEIEGEVTVDVAAELRGIIAHLGTSSGTGERTPIDVTSRTLEGDRSSIPALESGDAESDPPESSDG